MDIYVLEILRLKMAKGEARLHKKVFTELSFFLFLIKSLCFQREVSEIIRYRIIF